MCEIVVFEAEARCKSLHDKNKTHTWTWQLLHCAIVCLFGTLSVKTYTKFSFDAELVNRFDRDSIERPLVEDGKCGNWPIHSVCHARAFVCAILWQRRNLHLLNRHYLHCPTHCTTQTSTFQSHSFSSFITFSKSLFTHLSTFPLFQAHANTQYGYLKKWAAEVWNCDA